MFIDDGTGSGYLAEVNSNNQLEVNSQSESLQHTQSSKFEQAYQVIGTETLSSGTVVGLHIKNTSTDKNLVVTYIRHQIIGAAGGTEFPNASNYYRIAIGRTYASGGSAVTPINVFAGSGNEAEATVYNSDPTLAGTASEIDRWYTKANGDMNSFNKEGAVILPPQQTMELSYVGDRTSGTLYTRLSFIMKKI